MNLLALWVCFALFGAVEVRASESRGSSIDLTIFHTNDLHSQLHGPRADPFQLGGLARLSALLKNLRASRELSITLDGGDWSEGTWYYNLDTGSNMLLLMDEMGFDATVVGNHDYLSGPDQLMETVRRAHPRFPVLAANFDLSKYERAAEFQKIIPKTAILEKGGLKIGLIGMSCWGSFFDHYMGAVDTLEPIRAARRVAKELRPQVDVLIVLSHNFLPLNVMLAKAVPDVDAVISGHLHIKTVKAKLVENRGRKVPVVEAGDWGAFVGELTLRVDKATKKVTYIDNQLHPVLPLLEEDPLIASRVAEEDARMEKLYGGNFREVVAHSEIDLDDLYAFQAGLGDLVTKAYRERMKTDIAFEVMPFLGIPIPAGPVTVQDIHDVIPHLWDPAKQKEWTLKKVRMKGKEVLKLLRLQHLTDTIPLKRSGFVAFDNLEVIWKPKKGKYGIPKIVNVWVGGQLLQEEMEYSLVFTEGALGALQMLSDKLHLGIKLGPVEESGLEAWRVILDYARNLKVITVQNLTEGRRNWTVGADPAVFHYGIRYEGGVLAVDVSNEGLAPTQGVELKCRAGLMDNPVVFKTDQQVFSPIGTVSVPELSSGQVWTAQMPWQSALGGGRFPVECGVHSKEDPYPANSSAMRVLWVNP